MNVILVFVLFFCNVRIVMSAKENHTGWRCDSLGNLRSSSELDSLVPAHYLADPAPTTQRHPPQ